MLGTISDIRRVAGYIYTFLSALFSSRVALAVRVLAAESQLAECKRRIEKKDQPRPKFTQPFKLLWVFLSRFRNPWNHLARLMQPATVKRWHTTAFRLYWGRKSSRQGGRPAVPRQMRAARPTTPLLGSGATVTCSPPYRASHRQLLFPELRALRWTQVTAAASPR